MAVIDTSRLCSMASLWKQAAGSLDTSVAEVARPIQESYFEGSGHLSISLKRPKAPNPYAEQDMKEGTKAGKLETQTVYLKVTLSGMTVRARLNAI